MPKFSLALSLVIAFLAIAPGTFAQPAPIVAQGGGGTPVLVPTDVTGTQILDVDTPTPKLRVKFEKFPLKFDCKKCLVQEDTDTKSSALADGTITLETGKILVAPTDGRLLVHTKLANLAVPKNGIALIRCELNKLSIFNLGGHEFIIHFAEEGVAPHQVSIYNECIGLDEGFGIVPNDHTFTRNVSSGILQYVGTQASSSVVIAVAMRDCKLAVIDPMRILQHDPILKSLTAEKWLSVLQKVEDTTERVGVWQKEERR